LSRSLDSYSRENAKLEQEKEIIEVLINSLFLSDGYKEINYHEEFVVRLPELISSLGELPPYIRDAFITLENYYKTEITPKWLEYINDHPNKDMLLVGEMGKYYPETILNFSGEDEILRKEFKNHLSDNEKELVYQIQKMKIFIEGGDVNAARLYLSELKDERVVRESLRICIEQDSPIFNDVLSHIQAPQYLGPQLVLAARLGRNEISTKLLPQITNQYYLARALEIALDNNDQDLVQTSIVGIKDSWFLNRSANKYPDNEIVSNTLKAISFKKSINELRELHSDKSDIILRISQEPFAHDFSKAVLSCLIRENEDALNKALNILEKPALLAWVNAAASQGPLKINYLKELNQEQLSNVIEILLEPQFRDWNSGSGSYEIIDYVINLDKPKRDIIFKVLSGFEEFDYHDNLKILSEFNPEQQNSALEILKKLNKEDVGKLLYALNRVNNAGEGELNNALKVLEVLEFKTFICNDPRDQKVIVKDRSNNPFASFSNKFDSPNVRKKLDCLMALDKEQINIVLESLKDIDYSRQELFLSMLGSRVAISHAAEDFSKLVSLVQLPKEELENLLGRDAREPIIALALEHIMPPMVSHVSIVASNNMMISGVQGGVSSAQMSDLGATNIAPQFALAATTAKLALGVRGYFSNLLAGKVVTTNSSSINHDAMDMENKLQSLSSKFKELYDKNVEEYTDIHIKEGKHLKDLHNKARDTLNRLNKFNKRSKSEVEEVLLHDAKEIFTDYKKLKKELKEIKQLQNAKSLVHVNGLEDKLKEAGVHVAKKPISFVNRVKPASRDNSRGY